jgi:hypothetical protein
MEDYLISLKLEIIIICNVDDISMGNSFRFTGTVNTHIDFLSFLSPLKRYNVKSVKSSCSK